MSDTHWEGCEDAHHDCALAKLAATRERIKDLHENGERLMESANGWKAEAERLRGIERALGFANERIKVLEEALRHILWIKDCGIDASDENGVFRNHPDEERDEMYRLARAALNQNADARKKEKRK